MTMRPKQIRATDNAYRIRVEDRGAYVAITQQRPGGGELVEVGTPATALELADYLQRWARKRKEMKR